jgi:hypothetical protein
MADFEAADVTLQVFWTQMTEVHDYIFTQYH